MLDPGARSRPSLLGLPGPQHTRPRSETRHGTREASTEREQWSGQTGFILAAIGSAVGLGNIWRFPGVAYENGGGAFLVPYVIALLVIGIPVLLLDYSLGHRFRGSAPTVFRRLPGEPRRSAGSRWASRSSSSCTTR